MVLEDLRESAIELDNGGGTEKMHGHKGKRDPKSSDNPDKAIISLKMKGRHHMPHIFLYKMS